jgi:hypothetical protein
MHGRACGTGAQGGTFFPRQQWLIAIHESLPAFHRSHQHRGTKTKGRTIAETRRRGRCARSTCMHTGLTYTARGTANHTRIPVSLVSAQAQGQSQVLLRHSHQRGEEGAHYELAAQAPFRRFHGLRRWPSVSHTAVVHKLARGWRLVRLCQEVGHGARAHRCSEKGRGSACQQGCRRHVHQQYRMHAWSTHGTHGTHGLRVCITAEPVPGVPGSWHMASQ